MNYGTIWFFGQGLPQACEGPQTRGTREIGHLFRWRSQVKWNWYFQRPVWSIR